jgi:membrane-bound serine protease (ClpP class)
LKKKQLQGKLILSETLEVPRVENLSEYMGKEGKAATLLKPFGEVDFNGVRVQVTSNGPMIEVGTKVRVIETQSNKIIVCAVEGN